MKFGIFCLLFTIAFANQIEEKSITTCLLCKNLVGSSIDTIESTLEGFIVGIIDGAVNGFFEQSNVGTFLNSTCVSYCVGPYESLLPSCFEYVANFTTEIPHYVDEQVTDLVHNAVSGQLNADDICIQLAACP